MDNDRQNALQLAEAARVAPLDKTGSKWEVVLLREGKSRNRGKLNPSLSRYYPAKTVREAARLFEGAWSMMDHRPQGERDSYPAGRVMDRVGFFTGCRAEQARSDGKWEAKAVFECIDERLRQNLLNAWRAGRMDYAGFSIDADASGFSELSLPGEGLVEAVDGLLRVHSVDVVTEPAAGGGFTSILEADMTVTSGTSGGVSPADIEAIAQAAADRAASAAEARLAAALREALEAEEDEEGYEDYDEEGDEYDEDYAPGDEEGDEDEDEEWEDEEDDVTEAIAASHRALENRLTEAEFRAWRLRADQAIGEAKGELMGGLPAASVERLEAELGRLADTGDLSTDTIREAVAGERNYLGRIMQTNPAGTSPATLKGSDAGAEWYDRSMAMMLGRDINGRSPFTSLKEAYFTFPGHAGKSVFYTSPYEILGSLAVPYDSMTSASNVREAIYTTNFGVVMADVLHQAMQKRLTELPYNDWRKVVSQIQSVNDFKDHRWARVGMYDNLPSVGQGAPYQPMTSPTTEEALYRISKYGGLESISIEAIANDNVGATTGIPQRLAYAFARTLYESVMDTVTTSNPTLSYDSTALYHANHGNIATNPLTPAGVYTAQVAMRKLTPYGAPATEFMGERNRIKLCIVPTELEARARRIFDTSSGIQYVNQTAVSDAGAITRETDAALGIDPTYFQGKGVDVVVYDKASLTSAARYWLMGDKNLVDTVAVGFFQGRQTPDLFVQDANVPSGAAFSADMVSYKIRAFWGVGALEHRGLRQEGA